MGVSSTQMILDAVRDIHAKEQVVTRETLADYTGLTLTKVDDRIKSLVEEGLIVRVQRGVFVPAVQYPPTRPISKTILPDGMVKIEIGDEVLTLTPREARFLGEINAGAGMQMAMIGLEHQTTQGMADVMARVSRLKAEVASLKAKIKDSGDQLELI